MLGSEVDKTKSSATAREKTKSTSQKVTELKFVVKTNLYKRLGDMKAS